MKVLCLILKQLDFDFFSVGPADSGSLTSFVVDFRNGDSVNPYNGEIFPSSPPFLIS